MTSIRASTQPQTHQHTHPITTTLPSPTHTKWLPWKQALLLLLLLFSKLTQSKHASIHLNRHLAGGLSKLWKTNRFSRYPFCFIIMLFLFWCLICHFNNLELRYRQIFFSINSNENQKRYNLKINFVEVDWVSFGETLLNFQRIFFLTLQKMRALIVTTASK